MNTYISSSFSDFPFLKSGIHRKIQVEEECMKHNNLKKFPEDFFWGASSSAYQIEGAYNEDGKGLSVQDTNKIPEGTTDFKVASDHYHHVEEDIKLLAEMGFKIYRFSIAWTRIIPDGTGEVNQKGIDFYNRLINECIKYNIEPLVTIYHFDLPAALNEKGGWSNPESSDWFENYCKVLFEAFGDRVKYWLTINEQNMMILFAGMGMLGESNISPDSKNFLKEVYQQNHHMMVAQAKAMVLCHKMLPEAKIGPAPNISLVYPNTCKPEDVIAAQNFNAIRNWLYLDLPVYGIYNAIVWAYLEQNDATPDFQPGDEEILKAGKPDIIGFNYYNTATAEAYDAVVAEQTEDSIVDQQRGMKQEGMFQAVSNPYLPKTEFGWEVDPVGFRATSREIYSRYHLPMIVTENGLGAYDTLTEDGKVHDQYRIKYLKDHIEQMRLSITDGSHFIGYCPWSAIDLVSTHEGIKKRYGFVYVNRDDFDLKDLKRYPKDSFYWYKDVIESNGEKL